MQPAGQNPPHPQTILCAGEALIDLIAEPGGNWGEFSHMVPRIGGAPANMSVAIRKLGGRSSFVGVLANDQPGRWIAERLAKERVGLDDCHITERAQTRVAFVTGPPDQRTFEFYGGPAADELLTPAFVDQLDFSAADAVITGSLLLNSERSALAMHRLLERCISEKTPFVFDPNPRPSLWNDVAQTRRIFERYLRTAAILKLEKSELRTIGATPDEIREIQPANAILVITDGARGCQYWYGDERAAFVPAFLIDSVDSTGAGDAFTAALTLRFVQNGQSVTKGDFAFASAAGALATTRSGAMDALPTLNEVLELIDQQCESM